MEAVVPEDVELELERQRKRGVLLVLSGPSGVGKDTVMLKLLEKYPNMEKLVTTNSRPKRDDEKETYRGHQRNYFEHCAS